MSITANQMTARAMRLIRVLSSDAVPTAQEYADGLYALNAMLDAWSIERLMVYQIQQTTHSWTANASSRTIGSGGDFNTTRPVRIEETGHFFRNSTNIDYPVRAYLREHYDLIRQKTPAGSIPEFLFYDDGFPTRTLYAYPVLNETLTLYLNSWKPLQQFTSGTSILSLPNGYQAAIEYNLGIWIAPEFGAAAVAAAKDIEKQALMLKANIKGIANVNLISQIDVGFVNEGRPSRIESDT